MTKTEVYPELATKIGDSPHICREDLLGADAKLTIAAAAEGKGAVSKTEAFKPGKNKKEPCHVLHFEETEKTLVLNVTNRKALQRKFGNKTKAWVGNKIILFFDETVRCPDGTHGGTRIRMEV